ncbi:synaptosomal-associated protein 29 [Caerostris extrusa]|uniref:Synaptosomal-associated protein 29 n=1 Tax=Caerostris extrusa TaxID=172846 RepID=A0AAV4XJ36_CAEEX|nr:synaptosomal-associated protein 29 [Caerostris extrusa]
MAKEVKSANPFLDDDEDIDDNDFLNHPRQGKSGYMFGNDSGNEQNEWEIKRKQLLEERRRIEERTLQSTNNSLGLLHESEQVGILTAEELVKQREQLENIEENLDVINNTMRTSQKHINSLKSIFEVLKIISVKVVKQILP